MSTLVRQAESAPDELNRTHGFEVFHDPAEGYYTARFHIRTYDGIRVDSSWASDEFRLSASTEEGASRETRLECNKWWRILHGLPAEPTPTP